MQIDVYSSAGQKTKSLDLPETLFDASVNWGLMHQAVVLQQSNRRQSSAHVKTRGEVTGSTRKLFSQKHTGRARRGAIRSPLLRGGGKVFGPRNERNFTKNMPKKMRHAALRSGLSLQAEKGAILGLESYPDTIKTKQVQELLQKLPLEHGRRILLVTPATHNALYLSARNISGVKTVAAAYLNIEDVLNARHVIFLVDALAKAEEVFGKTAEKTTKTTKKTKTIKKTKKTKTTKTTKKTKTKKAASSSSAS